MTASALAQRLEERLNAELLRRHLQVLTADSFHIEERDPINDCAADVELMLPAPRECLMYAPWKRATRAKADGKTPTVESTSDTTYFQYLRNQQLADGILLVPRDDGQLAAHIVECKKTLGYGDWRDAKRQFAGALYRLQALAYVLELRIEPVTCYAAFRESLMVRPTPATTIFRHVHSGQAAAPTLTTDHATGQADLGPPFGRVTYRDIPLTVEQRDGQKVGCARVALAAA